MLEYSKNHPIADAYRNVIAASSDLRREYAYHCTNVSPDVIRERGFVSGSGGYTESDNFHELNLERLPESMCFVSREPWDDKARYVLKVDITGLKKYPDFGRLIDLGAYYDDAGDGFVFWWEDKDITPRRSDFVPEELARYLLNTTEDFTLHSDDIDGNFTWRYGGTCCVDGREITPDRIVGVDVNESSYEEGRKWNRIRERNGRLAAEKAARLYPADLAASLVKSPYGGVTVEIGGTAKDKMTAAARRPFTSVVHMPEGGNVLYMDVMIEPVPEWNASNLNALLGYLEKEAPWVHCESKMVKDRMTFARLSVRDPLVLNAYRKLVGRDSERTDFVQGELFPV